jgi:hypothetical protein
MRAALRATARFAFLCLVVGLFAICLGYFLIPTAIVIWIIAGAVMARG